MLSRKFLYNLYVTSPWGWRFAALFCCLLFYFVFFLPNTCFSVPTLTNYSLPPETRANLQFNQPTEVSSSPDAKYRDILHELNARVDRSRAAQREILSRSLACEVSNRGAAKGSLTRCLTPIVNANGSVALDFVPRASCARFGFCNGHGSCFLGKCFCEPGRSGDGCEIEDGKPVPQCSITSDICYVNPSYGIPRIPLERWTRASWAETAWWTAPDRQGDDNDNAEDSKGLFENYRAVPDNLGHVLELGCGPFTQLKSILGVPNRNWKVDTVTLSDPILVVESTHAKSSFARGTFEAHGKRYPTKLIQVGAEEVGSLYHDKFDTVIMQNVLEHVVNAFDVLESIYNTTKPGGIVVFWEPTYNNIWNGWNPGNQPLAWDDSTAFDLMAHPIRLHMSVFQYFASFFEPIMYKETPGRRGDNSVILVGRKKKPTELPYF